LDSKTYELRKDFYNIKIGSLDLIQNYLSWLC
jgi:hypothetical protein